MFELKFTLRQHTPLIHFQPKTGGATLRGTELKPKLDNYLIGMMGGLDTVAENYMEWLIPGQKAFDYKVRISADHTIHNVIDAGVDNRPPFFFGNMGEDYERNPNKYLNFSEEPITVIIRTFNGHKINGEGLIEYIQSVLPTFFLSVNFGTRQSKGYGSFYIHEQDSLYEHPEDRIAFQNDGTNDFLPFSFSLKVNGTQPFQGSLDALRNLEVFYKAMRSGINKCYGSNKHYLKSLLWLYFKRVVDNDIKWEKKKIKDELLGGHRETLRQPEAHAGKPGYSDSPLGSPGTHELLIKDLFGLATEETWEAGYGRFSIEKGIVNVDRFKSPVFFKPLLMAKGYRIFFHAIELNQENSIVDKTVVINGGLKINTPKTFDFHRFFNFLCNQAAFDLDNHFIVHTINAETGSVEYRKVSTLKREGNTVHERIENYRILKGIFNELQSR